ncbi:F-box protein CPR1 [Gossypium raimondii]|uniref:F-box protein CPR1 n=1 Tax=Gossypium raimondii TaxID=29730 RepID=UPI00227C0887|nr:F-box protein CPR1 [Gossypium raimondii]
MGRIPHETTIDILGRLSVKDLLRFKCVSKPWCSSIEDPYFIKFHLSHSLKTNTNHSLFLRHREYHFFSVNCDSLETTQILNHPFGEPKRTIQILGSCNGLLALVNDNDSLLLWNPSTRESQVLPSNEIEFVSPRPGIWLYVSQRSPPSGYIARSTYYGFGYDPISDDYKLVRMIQSYGLHDENVHSEAKVYSLRSNRWRRIKDFSFYLNFSREFGILANNALHWMVFRTPEPLNKELVGFDLGSEEFRFLELPDCYLDEAFFFDIKAMGGDICLTATFRDFINVDVWIMKEYGVKESWIKLVSYYEPESIQASPFPVPLAFSKNGDKVLLFIAYKWCHTATRTGKFVWYDLESQRVEKVEIRGIPASFDVDLYVDSLVPLNTNDLMFYNEMPEAMLSK